MKEFFLELFSEEIPANLQLNACKSLQKSFTDSVENLLEYQGIRTFVTPTRLVLVCEIAQSTSKTTNKVRGPQTSANQSILEKFTSSKGIQISDCHKEKVGEKEYWFYLQKTPSQKFEDIIPTIVENIITQFPWPKVMTWNQGNVKWTRPLRNIFACFDGKFIPIDINGICHNDEIIGHKSLGGSFSPRSFEEYKLLLKKNYVILDHTERQNIILQQIQKLEKEHNIRVPIDKKLLDEITGLVEFPTTVLGKIQEKFLALPQEVITSLMSKHQKFMSVMKDEQLAPLFVSVCNITETDNFIHGNQKVLTARLSDAEFFFDNDLKIPLEDKFEELKKLSFYEKLGTVKDRVLRIKIVAAVLAPHINLDAQILDRAATLSKYDLTTEMVIELPELQGVMGAIYAKAVNEPKEVCNAIKEQYLPTATDGPLPQSPYGVALALADKVELLMSFFSIGEKLKGSRDPLGLRRAGIGIIRILLTHGIHLDLREVLYQTAAALDNCQGINLYSQIMDYFLKFISERFYQIASNCNGLSEEFLKAVMLARKSFDFTAILKDALKIAKHMDNSDVLSAYKRLYKAVQTPSGTDASQIAIDTFLFSEAPENALYEALLEAQEIQDIDEFFNKLPSLALLINDLLDNVFINVNNDDVRNNRLNLLAFTLKVYEKYIKFSLLF